MRTGSWLATAAFTLVAFGHATRLALGLPVTVGTTAVPMGVSVAGVVVPLILAVMLWREHRPAAPEGME